MFPATLVAIFMFIVMTHRTKIVAKRMKNITEGPVKERGKKWFQQLVDKHKDVLQSEIFVCVHVPKCREKCEDTSVLYHEDPVAIHPISSGN